VPTRSPAEAPRYILLIDLSRLGGGEDAGVGVGEGHVTRSATTERRLDGADGAAVVRLDVAPRGLEDAQRRRDDVRLRLDDALKRLARPGVLEVIVAGAASVADSVLGHLKRSGGALEVAGMEDGLQLIRYGTDGLPPLAELVELEPPLPAERVLVAAHELAPGESFMAHVPRAPRFLYPQLEARGLEYQVIERPDTTAVLWLRRPRGVPET
jgi:hypothetical protein